MNEFITRIDEHKTANVIASYSDHLDEHGHVSVTEWANGEGYDVSLAGEHCNHIFQITHTQWDVLKEIMQKLRQEENVVQPLSEDNFLGILKTLGNIKLNVTIQRDKQ